ncbi:MAG: L,D-transpeptidase [Hyphomicrobium sp.]|nr:L,D-transpeptidase [Hyphomicrobium sp.]
MVSSISNGGDHGLGFAEMTYSISRRGLIAGALACVAAPAPVLSARSEWFIGVIPDRPFDIKIVDKKKIPPRFHRQYVPYSGPEPIGTILINKSERMLYYIESPGRALRFGVAVGRDGRRWSGEAIIQRRAVWPGWTPTANMRRRDPSLPTHVPGGPRNPLGARALYLYRDGRDTLYRIHGTNEPWSIGKLASSGCIRMLNEHVFELFGTVRDGARVVVI